MMRHLIEQYPQQALDALRDLQRRAQTTATTTVAVTVSRF